jgi:hypothetical protein
MRGIMAMSDKVLRGALKLKAEEYKGLFKK